MKKLLSILGSIGLVATSSMMVVSCGIKDSDTQSLPSQLQEQNFYVLNEMINSDKSIKDFITKDDFFYSNGLTGDNKYIGPRSENLSGSFGYNDWTLVDQINSKFLISKNKNDPDKALKRTVKEKEIPDTDKSSFMKDLLQYVDKDVENYDELSKIKFKSVSGNYKKNGVDKVVTDKDTETDKEHYPVKASDIVNEAFNKIINLGNTTWWEKNGEPKLAAWEKQKEFLDSNLFTDVAYQRDELLAYGEKEANFHQIIKIESVGALRDDKHNYLDECIEKIHSDLSELLKSEEDINKYMNQIFETLNVFALASQEYASSVDINSNSILSALKKQDDKILQTKNINDYVNNENKSVFGKFIVNNFPKDWENSGTTTVAPDPTQPKTIKLDTLDISGLNLLGLNSDGELRNNDWIKEILDRTKESKVDDLIKDYQIDYYQNEDDITPAPNKRWITSYYSNNSKVYAIQNKTIGDSNKNDVVKQIANNLESITFDSKLNIQDPLETSFSVYLSKITPDNEGKHPSVQLSFSTTGIDYSKN